MSPILVLGVGNTLMSDDGVGVHLLGRLQAMLPAIPGVEYVDAGTLSFVLLPRIQDCGALLVLDAAHFGEPPGAVRALAGGAMDEFLRTARCSVHEVGIRDLLDLARLTGTLPDRRGFIGIQPGFVEWGEQLSAPVGAAVPAAADLARGLLTSWCQVAGDLVSGPVATT
jgi:hydrogenase maturation protease